MPIKSPSNSRELPGQEDKTLKISSKVSYGDGFTWQTQAVHVRRCHLYFSRYLQANFKEMVHWSNIQWIWLIPTDPLAMNCITAELWMVHILHVHSQNSEPVRSHQSDQSQGSPSVPFPDRCYIVCCCSLAWGNHGQSGSEDVQANCGADVSQSLANKRLNYFYAFPCVQMCEIKSKWHYQASCLHQAEKNVNRQDPRDEQLFPRCVVYLRLSWSSWALFKINYSN